MELDLLLSDEIWLVDHSVSFVNSYTLNRSLADSLYLLIQLLLLITEGGGNFNPHCDYVAALFVTIRPIKSLPGQFYLLTVLNPCRHLYPPALPIYVCNIQLSPQYSVNHRHHLLCMRIEALPPKQTMLPHSHLYHQIPVHVPLPPKPQCRPIVNPLWKLYLLLRLD